MIAVVAKLLNYRKPTVKHISVFCGRHFILWNKIERAFRVTVVHFPHFCPRFINLGLLTLMQCSFYCTIQVFMISLVSRVSFSETSDFKKLIHIEKCLLHFANKQSNFLFFFVIWSQKLEFQSWSCSLFNE